LSSGVEILLGDILKKDIATVNWAKHCSPLKNGNLKIINLHHENNAYLLKFAWNFAYSNKLWSLLLKARVLKSKYKLRVVYRSSFIWYGIKQFYETILDHTYWNVGTSTVINFGIINGVLLLLYQILQDYLMVIVFRIQSFNFGLVRLDERL